MRINKYVAQATSMSRRAADELISIGRVTLNGKPPRAGDDVTDTDEVSLGGTILTLPTETITIIMNKPVGYVVSRHGQGSETVYDLLPPKYQVCKPVGRLDKDSSGLLLLTTDGQLAQELTHPSRQKRKVYEVTLNKVLQPLHWQMISEHGLSLEDGPSKLQLERLKDGNDKEWIVTMREGRNRQIRRTFEALGYRVTSLHRTVFGDYQLSTVASGQYRLLPTSKVGR